MMNRRAMSNFVKDPLKVAETVETIFDDERSVVATRRQRI
jgi:hypothetical protein